LSDIALDWSVADYALIALFICWPGLALGALCGALAWRRHRIWGGLIGAMIGCVFALGAFLLWVSSDLSLATDFGTTVLLSLKDAMPGIFVGGAIGAWLWRSRRISGATCGALVGLALWMSGWFYFHSLQ
jgi:hypothetical protein